MITLDLRQRTGPAGPVTYFCDRGAHAACPSTVHPADGSSHPCACACHVAGPADAMTSVRVRTADLASITPPRAESIAASLPHGMREPFVEAWRRAVRSAAWRD